MADPNSHDKLSDPDRDAELRENITHQFGLRQASSEQNLPVVCCLVRDGGYWLPSFLDHYRKAGVKEFFFLDNGSVDETLEILGNEQGVGVYSIDSRYFKNFNRHLRRVLVNTVRPAGWVIGVDIDELFDYPYSEEVSLTGLCDYLDDCHFNCVTTHMLDMLPEDSLSELARHQDSDPRELCPLYSLDGLNRYDYQHTLGDVFKDYPASALSLPTQDWPFFCDGIRSRKFGIGLWLTKHSLFKIDGMLFPYHHAHIHRNVRIADISGVLYHYKFSPSFEKQVEIALRERQYCDESYDYVGYSKAINACDELVLKDHTAKKLGSVNDLLSESFIHVPANFRSHHKK